MSYKCPCGGSLIPVKIGIAEKGIFKGTVCFKQWCPKCRNSKIDLEGKVIYYQLKGNNEFTFDPIEFWAPEQIKFQYKHKFIQAILKLADEHRFEGKQTYTMEQIREAYRGMEEA